MIRRWRSATAPSPVDHSWVFKIQIGNEQMLVQEPGTTVFDDWTILRGGGRHR